MRAKHPATQHIAYFAAAVLASFLTCATAHVRPGPDGTPQKHWVRYPFEFQLCGIGLGDKALDREEGNYLMRYCLFRIHGNPTAVVVGSGGLSAQQTPPGGVSGGAGGAGGEGGEGGMGMMGEGGGGEGGMMGEGGGGMGGPGAGAGGGGGGQQAQALSAGGPSPAWALAAWVSVDENHCEWMYQRDTYTMGFVVDRLGFIDQIVVAGTKCPIAATQYNDPDHRIMLGDDTQRVMLRYGYPDDIETYVSSGGGGGAVSGGGGGGGGGGAAGPGGGEGGMGEMGGGMEEMGGMEGGMEGGMGMGPGMGGGMGPGMGGPQGGGGGGGRGQAGPSLSFTSGGGGGGLSGSVSFQGVSNQLSRTFIFYYHDSYNVMFTLRDHKVVRINIFGDPDHFNPERRAYYRNNF